MTAAPCTCGHPHAMHEHLRRGSDCGSCGARVCPSYTPWGERPVWRPRLAMLITAIAISAGLALLGWWGQHEALGASTRCESTTCLKRALAWQRADRRHLHERLAHRDRVDLHRAIAISADLFGVSERAMACVAWAESGYGAQTTEEPSSGALGPFQWLASSWDTTPLGRAGYARTDFLAASLTTAQRVVRDHGWSEWVTGPGCGL